MKYQEITSKATKIFVAAKEVNSRKCKNYPLAYQQRMCNKKAKKKAKDLAVRYLKAGMSKCDDDKCRKKLAEFITKIKATDVG